MTRLLTLYQSSKYSKRIDIVLPRIEKKKDFTISIQKPITETKKRRRNYEKLIMNDDFLMSI
jgi:hypothetical protein